MKVVVITIFVLLAIFEVSSYSITNPPPKRCPVYYCPGRRHVCGSDGKTYFTQCGLNTAACEQDKNITLLHDGPCKKRCKP
jgi:hypothetical protein